MLFIIISVCLYFCLFVVVVVVVVFNLPFAMFDPYCTSPPRASGVKKLTFVRVFFFFFFLIWVFLFVFFYYYFLRLKSNKPVKFQCKTFVVGKQLFMLSHVTLKGE